MFQKLEKKSQKKIFNIYESTRNIHIKRINNFHDITDERGTEITHKKLLKKDKNWYIKRFFLFPKTTQNNFIKNSQNLTTQEKTNKLNKFLKKLSPQKRIKWLKNLTSKARYNTAQELSDAHLYTLLSFGGEHYESSFSKICLPEFLKRIKNNYDGSLLKFINQIDKGKNFFLKFILSLSNQGKLDRTLNVISPKEKQDILKLLTSEVLENPEKLLLFSSSLEKILKKSDPQLSEDMIQSFLEKLENSQNLDKKLEKGLILTFLYLQKYTNSFKNLNPKVLERINKSKKSFQQKNKEKISLEDFTKTPFEDWKKDGKLQSLSTFHTDQDGESSFISNALKLSQRPRYKISLSKTFSPEKRNKVTELKIKKIIKKINRSRRVPKRTLKKLYNLLKKSGYAITFSQKINGINITHDCHIYKNKKNQKKFLQIYIEKGFEMYGQRGHSYWREKQFENPLQELIEDGIMINGKKVFVTLENIQKIKRFISLGSCGGINSYIKLSKMLGKHNEILATTGTGTMNVNNPFNRNLFEITAQKNAPKHWNEVFKHKKLKNIFASSLGKDYLQSGSLISILKQVLL